MHIYHNTNEENSAKDSNLQGLIKRAETGVARIINKKLVERYINSETKKLENDKQPQKIPDAPNQKTRK